MLVKKFVPCIYLYNGHAVRRLTDLSVVETDPLRLVNLYNENGADGLVVFDMSQEDSEHEEALDIIKEICATAEMEVTGAGNIKRLEDVKKLLYAGCRRAVLDCAKESNIALARETSQRFGRDKLLASCDNVDIIARNRGLLEDCVSGLLLQNPHQIRETQAAVQLPFLVEVNQIALNKLMEIFAYENVCGVTGNTINDNYRDILALKGLCKENGILVETFEAALQWDDFQKNPEGLLPVIVQDYLWLKGETSGHFQYLKSLAADCDKDTLLARVSQVGAACHTGSRSCFFNEIVKKQGEETANPLQVFEEVFDVIKDRKLHPKEGSYTNYLFDKGIDKILKKLGEEATEIVIAAKNPGANEVKYEISDFLYHMMVLMAEKEIGWEEITTELANR